MRVRSRLAGTQAVLEENQPGHNPQDAEHLRREFR
jgi:hypothetical protein